MHNNAYNVSKRYRDRKRRLASRWMRYLFFLFLIFFLGVWLGKEYALSHVERSRDRLDEQSADIQRLQEELLSARTDAQTASMRFLRLKEEISKELPNEGPLRDLVAEMRLRLEEGMDPERLLFLIQSARPPRNCIDAETKRIVVLTPESTGPESSINIDQNKIIISGEGVAARNREGQPESWFDPAKPVTIYFQTQDGITEEKSGTFPLYHSLVVGDKEYRFTIDEGTRSFAKVTYDHCDYP